MKKSSKVMITIIIAILIIAIDIMFYQNISLKKLYKESLYPNNYTHIMSTGRSYGDMNEHDTITSIYTFNKDDMLVSIRNFLTFEKMETAKKQYELMLKYDNEYSEIKLVENVLVFKENFEGQITKSDIIESFKDSEYKLIEY